MVRCGRTVSCVVGLKSAGASIGDVDPEGPKVARKNPLVVAECPPQGDTHGETYYVSPKEAVAS